MKKCLFLACLSMLAANVLSAQQRVRNLPEYPKPDLVIELWPDGAPNDNGITEPEFDYGNHVTRVTRPTLSVFLPDGPCNGLAVISCPGGGYIDVWDKTEGYSLAPWYNSMGIVYAVLKYRLPNGHYEVPISDAERAIEVMLDRKSEYGFRFLGIQGNSAGGHLASWASCVACDDLDFTVLFYPVITMKPEFTHLGSMHNLLGRTPDAEECRASSSEEMVTPATPPAFIMHCTDDTVVPVRNSMEYYNALVENGIEYSSMYIMPVGGHGWTDNESFEYRGAWMKALETWLNRLPEVLKEK